MIKQQISTLLPAKHFAAFTAFADRLKISTTPEAIRRAIETLAEYKAIDAANAETGENAA